MADTTPRQPQNVPQAVDYLAQDLMDSFGGLVPANRSAYPPEYFVNPPLRNPTYSKRADTGGYPFPFAGNLFRGWIQEAEGTTSFAPNYIPSTDPARVYRCHFHFNPSDVTMDWQVTDPQFDPTMNQPGDNANIGVYQTQGVTFGINLLFDREGDNHPLVKGWGGVNSDIRILNAIMTSGSGFGQLTYATPAPVKCVIGRTYRGVKATQADIAGNRSFGGAPVAYPLAITGMMNSMSVDYQRFDAAMTPTRAVVSLSIQVLTFNPASGTPPPIKPIAPPKSWVKVPGGPKLS